MREDTSLSACMCARMYTQAHEDLSGRPSGDSGDRSFQIHAVKLMLLSVYCWEHGSYGDTCVRGSRDFIWISRCPCIDMDVRGQRTQSWEG